MKYYPHVDGLRAIAISLVLLFHAGLTLIPSGFIGVDVFFVISGFLITRIIHNDLNKGDFSFFAFYSRRLWRLQSALLAMLTITYIVTVIFYLPNDLMQFSKSANKTLIFTSNQFFNHVTGGYFAPDSNQLPLLHTWSLSIEWQCYLILPFIIYALHSTLKKQWFTWVIYGLTGGGMILSLYLSGHNDDTYYFFTSRFFEFLIGSSVALHSNPIKNRCLLEGTSAVALVLLFYLAFTPGIGSGFPNGYAIFLCLATACLIIAGEQGYKSWAIKLLSTRLIVFIGLISYSLYLWHWPIFGLLHYLEMPMGAQVMIPVFGLLILISYLSWRFIEVPSRHIRNKNFAFALVFLFIIPVVSFHTSYLIIKKHEGFPSRFPEATELLTRLKKYESDLRVECLIFKSAKVNKKCVFGSSKPGSQSAFLIGDSFSNHYWRFLEIFAKQAHVSVLANATGSCLALPGISQFYKSKIHKECYKQTQRYYQMIEKNHYNYVIIGESWNGYTDDRIVNRKGDERSLALSKQRIEHALDEALRTIVTSGAKPIILKDIAVNDNDDPYRCFFKYIKQRKTYQSNLCAYSINAAKSAWRNALFTKMKIKYPELVVIDPQKVLCSTHNCITDINKIPVFRDRSHLTDYASYMLGKRYLARYKNPFLAQQA